MFLNKKKIFFIAELGHNHMGSLKEACKLIAEAKKCGADAVKLQKRDNKSLYTKEFYNSPYENPNSYGSTYGLHREFLEFGFREYLYLKKYAKKMNIIFFATPFDFNSVKFLKKLNMPLYKIASADLTNIPLQTEIAKTLKPVILSTGGGSFADIDRAVKNILKINKKLVILHCTASYPVKISEMNLLVIETLKKKYKNINIGLSDHENGIDAGVVAYMLGARVFEKHFTLNRSNKGTDHNFSLEPIGLEKFIRNIKRVDILLGQKKKILLQSEIKPLFKMKKSIVVNRTLSKGHKLSYEDLAFKSTGRGLEPFKYKDIIGKKLKKNLQEEELVLLKDLEN